MFSTLSPIVKISNPQQLHLCVCAIPTCIKVSNLIHEVPLLVYPNEVIKLKIQPICQSQIHVARHLLAIAIVYLIEPSLPKPFVNPRRIRVFIFINYVNLFRHCIIDALFVVYI